MIALEKRTRWAEYLAAATAVLLAALLIFNCLDIYRIGTAAENIGVDGVRINDIYTREDVVMRLRGMTWAFWLWAAAQSAAIVCRHAWGRVLVKSRQTPEMQLERLKAHREQTPAMKAEERKRNLAAWLCGAVCAVCALASAVYLLKPDTFASTELERVMADLVLRLAPLLLFGFAALTVLAQLCYASVLREIEAAKGASVRTAEASASQRAMEKPYLQAVLFAAALALLIAGVCNGGMYDVLVKAVNICTECIGLG